MSSLISRTDIFHKRVKCLMRLHKSFSKSQESQLCSFIQSKRTFLMPGCEQQFHGSVLKSQYKNIFTSSFPKLNQHSEDKPNRSALEDEEFQNLLKDFAKDFGLNSESEALLDDIKKSLEEPSADSEPATEHNISSLEKSKSATASVDKFEEFTEKAVVIPSYEEYQSGKYNYDEQETTFHIDQEENIDFEPVDLKRGITGVFDMDELVDFLRKEKFMDVTVISVPKEYHYTDFLVLVTALSPRHSDAATENIIKLYKKKKNKSDPFIKAEGEDVDNWKVLDMGNIILHIFLKETRDFYDIESLWLLDSEYDTGGTLKEDPTFEALKEQMEFFHNLKNSSSKDTP